MKDTLITAGEAFLFATAVGLAVGAVLVGLAFLLS